MNVEVEKRMSRLNKRNTEIEKRRLNVKMTNKLNFDRKNVPYTFACIILLTILYAALYSTIISSWLLSS